MQTVKPGSPQRHLCSTTLETRLVHLKVPSPGDKHSWVLSGDGENGLQPLIIPLCSYVVVNWLWVMWHLGWEKAFSTNYPLYYISIPFVAFRWICLGLLFFYLCALLILAEISASKEGFIFFNAVRYSSAIQNPECWQSKTENETFSPTAPLNPCWSAGDGRREWLPSKTGTSRCSFQMDPI